MSDITFQDILDQWNKRPRGDMEWVYRMHPKARRLWSRHLRIVRLLRKFAVMR